MEFKKYIFHCSVFQRNVVLKFCVIFLSYWLHKEKYEVLLFCVMEFKLPSRKKVFQENNNRRTLLHLFDILNNSMFFSQFCEYSALHSCICTVFFLLLLTFTTLFKYFFFIFGNFWSQIRLLFCYIMKTGCFCSHFKSDRQMLG